MNLNHRRLLQLFAFLAAWAVVAIARLVQVQIVRHDYYVNKAQRQQERTLALSAVRGAILDRRGRVLAESVSAESIYADPQSIGDRKATARVLAVALHEDARELDAKLGSNSSFVWIARQLPLDVALEAKKLKLPGIYFLDEHRRSYPRGMLAANVVGYVGLDGQGLGGIEHSFDAFVRGKAGKVTLLRDARRGMYLVGGEGANRPVDGNDVVLTIDSIVQFIAERSLQKAIDKYHALGGSVIVMDPRDGSILAMASSPTFDPNHFGDFAPESWKNRNVQDMYEPGSTFKIITASAGLEEGVVTPSQVLDCANGALPIGNVYIHEHGHNRYGLLSFEDVMIHSSNIGAVRVGLALGQDRFYGWIRRFGFGERTGVPLPGESPGLLRHTERWSQLSNAMMSFGQEIAVTPLQLITAVAAVANGGVRVAPRVVDRVIDARQSVVYRPTRVEPQRVMSEKTAAVLNEILKAVVARGTGQGAALVEHVVAGKTGTAQKSDGHGYSPDNVVASFVGYVPADRPRLVILAVVDEPRGSQFGGTVAAPVFREVAESTLRYLGVQPSIPARTLGVEPATLAAFSRDSESNEPAQVASVAHDASAPASLDPAPDLRGLDLRTAVARAVASGVTVRVVGAGVVQTQIPEPGGALPRNREMTLNLGVTPNATKTPTHPCALWPCSADRSQSPVVGVERTR
jgi:cell division protein FtsI (penicillin-binding protein 3)